MGGNIHFRKPSFKCFEVKLFVMGQMLEDDFMPLFHIRGIYAPWPWNSIVSWWPCGSHGDIMEYLWDILLEYWFSMVITCYYLLGIHHHRLNWLTIALEHHPNFSSANSGTSSPNSSLLPFSQLVSAGNSPRSRCCRHGKIIGTSWENAGKFNICLVLWNHGILWLSIGNVIIPPDEAHHFLEG